MSIRTNQCLHCGKSREEHLTKEQISRLEYLESALMPHPIMLREIAELYKKEDHIFQDSGLAALDAHKEELYEVANDICDEYHYTGRIDIATELRLQSILNQIDKEK